MIWVKPNGVKVPVNAGSEAHARSLGWLPESEYVSAEETLNEITESEPKQEAPKRRGRPLKGN
jgi:hypothetical protein